LLRIYLFRDRKSILNNALQLLMVAKEVLDCIINDDVFIQISFYLQSRVMLELTTHDCELFYVGQRVKLT